MGANPPSTPSAAAGAAACGAAAPPAPPAVPGALPPPSCTRASRPALLALVVLLLARGAEVAVEVVVLMVLGRDGMAREREGGRPRGEAWGDESGPWQG